MILRDQPLANIIGKKVKLTSRAPDEYFIPLYTKECKIHGVNQDGQHEFWLGDSSNWIFVTEDLTSSQAENILQEANRLVYGDRATTHGDYRANFDKTAEIFNAWVGEKRINGVDVSRILQSLKMAREICNPKHRDNYTDTCGYVELRYRMLKDLA